MAAPQISHEGTGVIYEVPGVGIVQACGDNVPADGSIGFAPCCLFQKLNASSTDTKLYLNTGTKASCNFDAIDLTTL